MEKEAAKAKKAAEVKAKQDAERAAREAAEPVSSSSLLSAPGTS